MSAAVLLDRLDKVRARGPGQWSACCPAHDDKGPSLSVKETADGRVLLHCFAGCEVDEVTAAVGLDLADLFPPRETSGAPLQRRHLLPAGQALELIHDEGQLIAVAGVNIAHKVTLTDADLDRVLQAAGRISALLDGVRL
ncbi:MAG: DNA primase [Rhizobacter sp.]|nr:DNA primase [Rhizobacter sp.]